MSDYAGYVPGNAPDNEQTEMQENYSHLLTMADGSVVKYAVDDLNPHAALPTQVDGVAVVSVAPATIGGPA
jgi:hypothetical protein